VSSFGEDRLAEVRNRRIGFVFQSFNLLPRLPALQQVELPLIYRGIPRRRELSARALTELGLGDRIHHRPSQLSGGERQRVSIARALSVDPDVILADEPTGNLDSKTGLSIMDSLKEIQEKEKKTVIVVTHDPELLHYADRIVHLKDGKIEKIAGRTGGKR
jgi:putative ABC transport system ATP-binding protein